MENMKMYVWLLPVLFILHDMEEIAFARKWKEDGAKKSVLYIGLSLLIAIINIKVLHKYGYKFSSLV